MMKRCPSIFVPLFLFILLISFSGCGSGEPAPGRQWVTPASIEAGPISGLDAVTVNSAGAGIVVWQSQVAGGPLNVSARRFSLASATLDSTVQLASIPPGGGIGVSFISRAAIDPLGNMFVVWLNDDGTGIQNVRLRRYSVASGTWGDAFDVQTNLLLSAFEVGITVDSTGNATVVWTQVAGVGLTDQRIWTRRFLAATGTWNAPQEIQTGAYNAATPVIGNDASGNVTVVWAQGTQNVAWDAWTNRYSVSSGTWGTPVKIATLGADLSTMILAVASSGNAVAAWPQGDVQNTPRTLMASRYTASSDQWAVPVNVGGPAALILQPQVAVDASGNAFLIWEQTVDAIPAVRVSRFNAATATWSAPASIQAGTISRSAPMVAFESTGDAVAVWSEGAAASSVIKASRYALATGIWELSATISATAIPADVPFIAIDGSGRALAAWAHGAPTAQSISARMYR